MAVSKPCFLVLGKPKCGKSSLLMSAELKGLQITNLETYQIWQSETVTFIELNDDEFLRQQTKKTDPTTTLKKQLAHKRLNGIIIAIESIDLHHSKRQNLISKLKPIASALNELKHKEKFIPIYLIVTKSDLLAGFNEFFAESSKEERTQVCGITFESRLSSQHEKAFIFTKFKAFLQKLHDQLVFRLHKEHNETKRALIKDFPLQIESIQETIIAINLLLHLPKFQVQGIYFTSSIQSGEAFDCLTKFLSSTISSEKNLIPLRHNQAPAFFIRKLVNEIFNNNVNFQHSNLRKQKPTWLYPITGIIALAIITFSTYAYYRNQNTIEQVNSILANNQQQTTTQYEYINKIEELMQADNLLNQHHTSWLIGFNQQQQLKSTIQTALLKTVDSNFIPLLQSTLENTIHEQLKSTDNLALYQSLKVYLMLANPQHQDDNTIIQWFKQHWSEQFPNNAETAPALTKLLTALLNRHGFNIQNNQQLVSQARNTLTSLSASKLSLIMLIDDNQIGTQQILANSAINRPTYVINRLYTKAMLNQVTNELIPTTIKSMSNENWILGTNTNQNTESATALAKQVQTLFLQQYAEAWGKIVNAISLGNANNLQQLDTQLKTLNSSTSPLIQLLQTIRENTEPVGNNVQFNNLVSLKFASLDDADQINQAHAIISQLQQYVEKINRNNNSNQAAFAAAVARMQDNQSDTINQALNKAKNLTPPLNNIISKLSLNTWQIILGTTTDYINQMWANNVVPKYNTDIANKYPIFKTSVQQLSLNKFTEFFGPNGTMDSFFDNYLQPFVDTSHLYWQWKKINGLTLNISQPKLEMFIRAGLIKRMFFPNDRSSPEVEFYLYPASKSASIADVTIDIDGQLLDRAAHDENKLIRWPIGTKQYAKISLVNHDGQVANENFYGPWSLFQLFDNANITSTQNAQEYELTFAAGNNSAHYQLKTKDLVNAFLPEILDNFRCPEKL